MSPPVYWTKSRITLAIRAHHNQHGVTPMARDWTRGTPDHPSNETVYRNYPSWADAIRDAGLEPQLRGPDVWTKAAVIASLHRWVAQHGAQPGQGDWYRGTHDHPAHPTVRRLFGSWNNGIAAAGLNPRPAHHQRVREWTRDETIGACQAWYLRQGRRPQQLDWRPGTDDYPSDAVVRRLFGRWNRMLRASSLASVYVPTSLPTSALAAAVRPHITEESQRQLAERAGMTERSLYRILTCETERTDKRIADRLLVALDRPDAWHIELAEYAA